MDMESLASALQMQLLEKDATLSINKTNNSMGIIQGDIFQNISK